MEMAIKWIQLASAILLTLVILVQNRGTGLSSTFGGDGGGFYATKRGAEKMLANATIVLMVAFLVFSLAAVLVESA